MPSTPVPPTQALLLQQAVAWYEGKCPAAWLCHDNSCLVPAQSAAGSGSSPCRLPLQALCPQSRPHPAQTDSRPFIRGSAADASLAQQQPPHPPTATSPTQDGFETTIPLPATVPPPIHTHTPPRSALPFMAPATPGPPPSCRARCRGSPAATAGPAAACRSSAAPPCSCPARAPPAGAA